MCKSLLVATILAALIGAFLTGAGSSVEQATQQPGPQAGKAKQGLLTKKKHWSSKPLLAGNAELIAYHFIQFTTAGNKTFNAKVFLTAVRPPVENLPARIFGTGYEIEADADFVPDFKVGSQFVKELPANAFEVDLGAVKYRVQTTGG